MRSNDVHIYNAAFVTALAYYVGLNIGKKFCPLHYVNPSRRVKNLIPLKATGSLYRFQITVWLLNQIWHYARETLCDRRTVTAPIVKTPRNCWSEADQPPLQIELNCTTLMIATNGILHSDGHLWTVDGAIARIFLSHNTGCISYFSTTVKVGENGSNRWDQMCIYWLWASR